jgi:hypothetical protein
MNCIKRKILSLILTTSIFILSSCTTYYMSPISLKQQLQGIDSTKLKQVTVKGPGGSIFHYPANPIQNILCTDKIGDQEAVVKNGPSIEIRFTHGYRNKRTIFYFDRILLNNNSVVGVESRLISSISKSIPLDSVTKIEVQDGHKNFRYINN